MSSRPGDGRRPRGWSTRATVAASGLLSNGHDVELLVVQVGVGADCHRTAELLLQLAQHRALLFLQGARDVRVDPQQDTLAVQIAADAFQFREYLEADRGA